MGGYGSAHRSAVRHLAYRRASASSRARTAANAASNSRGRSGFAVWNAAPPDQQCGFLNGDEVIELVNLCPSRTPGATCDRQGHTWLRLTLPGNLPFILTRFDSGALGEVAANLDTLLIDVEARQVTCVWRATLGSAPPVRRLEARLLRPAQLTALRADAAAPGCPPDGR